MPNTIKAAVWTDWVMVSARQRVYALSLHQYKAAGIMWEADRSITLRQFTMIASQGALTIITEKGDMYLKIPLSKVPVVSVRSGKSKEVLRLGIWGKLAIVEGWRAEVEFFDRPTAVQDPDRPDRETKDLGGPWAEFPGDANFRLVVV